MENNYIKHAKREFEILGWPGKCEMQKEICNGVFDLLNKVADQGHSGTSIGYMMNLFNDLVKFKPISPLTGDDSEWMNCHGDVYQNIRASHVFKDSKDGQAYDINGKIFRSKKGGCYTNHLSRVDVEFPYTPNTEYVDVD